MKFMVVQAATALAKPRKRAAYLLPDEWDDYSFRTTFDLYIALRDETPEIIGSVKILSRTYDEELRYHRTTDRIESKFDALPPGDYCSLGQQSDYYRKLGQLPDNLGSKILTALNDVVFTSHMPRWWEGHSGYETSLRRTRSAKIAWKYAHQLFQNKDIDEERTQAFRFRRDSAPSAPPGLEAAEFRFDGELPVSGRLQVLVGKNGTGKTALLAGIAAMHARPVEFNKFADPENFSRVVVLSFNAFDTALHPASRWRRSDVRYAGFIPLSRKLFTFANDCRKLGEPPSEGAPEYAAWRQAWTDRLLRVFPSPEDVDQKIPVQPQDRAIEVLESLNHDPEWREFIKDALEDHVVAEALYEDAEEGLRTMSAGQRVLTMVLSSLFEHMDRRSLVLLDEPENHLHPSLVARFIRKLNKLLSQRKSFAILATHSPIILQETPSSRVTVLTRINSETTASSPPFETLGESVEVITERLFETDFRSSHWKRVLKKFAEKGLSDAEIQERLSNRPLSMYARTYLEYQRRELKA